MTGVAESTNRPQTYQVLYKPDAAASLPAGARGIEHLRIERGALRGRITETVDPFVPLAIAAGTRPGRWLLLDLRVRGVPAVSIYYYPEGATGFSERWRRHFALPDAGDLHVVWALDMGGAPDWGRELAGLRLDFDNSVLGAEFALFEVGAAGQLPDTFRGRTVRAVRPAPPQAQAKWERMAAFHQTVVTVDELVPAAGICTYHNERFEYATLAMLCKAVTGVDTADGPVWCCTADDVEVREDAGIVRAKFRLAGTTVTLRVMPLIFGRTPPAWEGRALVRVESEPPRPLVVDVGGYGPDGSFWQPRQAWLRSPQVGTDEDKAAVRGGVGFPANPRSPRAVAVRGAVPASPVRGPDRNAVRFRFQNGTGWLVVAFAGNETRAARIADIAPDREEQRVRDHYAKLLGNAWIDTPEDEIDATFRSALVTCEYCWLRPWGWVEGIHHWMAMWHMQHSQMADWVGQQDRAEENILWLLRHLRADGAVQHFAAGGFARRDFGGSNQFLAWQIQRHWRSTGDRAFLEKIEAPFDRVVRQTWQEYDPDGNGLLKWGLQVGNQEDYVMTPDDGASPTIAGIEILRTQAMTARGLGRTDKAGAIDARIAEITARLRQTLWMPDLGRFMFYRDALGVVRPEGQYHTLAWPVIFDLLDPLDAWTSVRHLRDRLMGPDGALYLSNNFPCHTTCTTGPQAGGQQQPWGAMALARIGLNNDAIRPIRFIAHIVQASPHNGVWPEIAKEPTPAYFSPPAAVYVFGIIEGVFGLDADVPAGRLRVRPAFPDAWPRAALHLPEYDARFARNERHLRYEIRSRRLLRRAVRWHLPVSYVGSVTVNGRPARFTCEPAVNGVVLRFDTEPLTESTIEIDYRPRPVRVTAPRSIAEGETFTAAVDGAGILRVVDREHVLDDIALEDDRITARVRDGLLEPWLRFGRLGQMNFSRRTFFLECRSGALRFYMPVDLTVLPPVEVAAGPDLVETSGGCAIDLLIHNNRECAISGPATLKIAGTELPLSLDLPPRSRKTLRADLPSNCLCLLTPGENPAVLRLPDGGSVRFTVLVQRLFATHPVLAPYLRKRVHPLPLPAEALIAPKTPMDLRWFGAFGHPPWRRLGNPVQGIPEELTVPNLPGVLFRTVPGKLLLVSGQKGAGSIALPVNAEGVRKIWLLLLPAIDNHDVYTPVIRISARCDDRLTISRTLCSPGDLDWFPPPGVVGEFATARVQRPLRYGLLPLLGPDDADWARARPEAFPQPEFWAESAVYHAPQAVLNAVALDLGGPRSVHELRIDVAGTQAAVGVIAVTLLKEDAALQQHLPDDLRPPARLRAPLVVFDFADGRLHGWKSEPAGVFTVRAYPALFPQKTLNSLAARGESATGRAVSPPFPLDGDRLELLMQGGKHLRKGERSLTWLALRDVESGKELLRVNPSGSHILSWEVLDVSRWKGRRVRIELVDENPGTAYAWIGLARAVLKYTTAR